ncbi:STAS domain-containing protein [Dactylosporangium sp. NPDC006015]|uniref:STAS domain-containing protein n=1 Tax=Dactylosporangium sp. NPDC006015 TaxID=3154576 RepID=UPI00339DF81F
MPADLLVCDLEHRPPLAYVTARGTLDPLSATVLRQSVLKALTGEPAAVLVDLAGVTVADPVALTVFLSLSRAAAAWPGAQIVIHSAAPAVARDLDSFAIVRHTAVAAGLAEAEALAARQEGAVQVGWDVHGLAGGLAGGLAQSRDVVRAFCRRHGREALTGHAELVITELVVNAFRHGAAPVTAWVSIRGRYLHLAVRDRAPSLPRLPAPAGSVGGLMIVEALTVAWGATRTADGKTVWCTLRP